MIMSSRRLSKGQLNTRQQSHGQWKIILAICLPRSYLVQEEGRDTKFLNI